MWCGVVQSDYSVSSLSEKESKERERELDNIEVPENHLLDGNVDFLPKLA